MTTSYPGALDAFPDPTGSDRQNSATVPHATQHRNVNDAIEAIEAELGTNPKGNFADVRARLDSMAVDLADALGGVIDGEDGEGLDAEAIMDLLSATLLAGSGISISYNDALDTLTFTNSDRGSSVIAAHEAADSHPTYYNQARGDARYSLTGHNHSGVYSPVAHDHDADYADIVHLHPENAPLVHTHPYADVSHTHTSANITDFAESVQDILGAAITAGSNITVQYDDDNGLVYINSDAGGGGGGGTVYSQDTEPATPAEGQIWQNTATPIWGIQVPPETATPFYSVTKGGLSWYQDSVLMIDNGRFLMPVGGDPRKYYVNHTEGLVGGSHGGWTQVAANGGNVGSDSAANNATHPGVMTIETGTTSNATGRAHFGGTTTASQAYWLSSGLELMYEALVYLPVLQDGSSNYCVHLGYTNTNDITGADATDGIYFRFNPTDTTWVACVANGGAPTTQSTGISVVAATWYTLRIAVMRTQLALFYVNDQLRNIVSTGLPVGASRNFTVSAQIGKRQSSVTNRQLLLDYMYHHHVLTTKRF